MNKNIYNSFQSLKDKNQHGFAMLIDPDNIDMKSVEEIAQKINEASVDYIFLGGSLMLTNHAHDIIAALKEIINIDIVLFPGSPSQVVDNADGLLYLSLISGRNPDLLIGQHVISAPNIKRSKLEIIPTGYMVVDGGVATTVSYMSHSAPIPGDKVDIALCTAWAGELLGMKTIYLDAGSGARYPITAEMIQKVSSNIDIPLIVGGGIRSASKAIENCKAGAQIIVVGNAIEKDFNLIKEIGNAVKSCN